MLLMVQKNSRSIVDCLRKAIRPTASLLQRKKQAQNRIHALCGSEPVYQPEARFVGRLLR